MIHTVLDDDQKISLSGSSPEYVFIHSHRRSGTHLLIDTISGWFDVVPGFWHFPTAAQTSVGSNISVSPETRLVKSHEPIYGFTLNAKHIWDSPQHLHEGRRIYENNPHIYIIRNPFLVLRSLYVFDITGTEAKFKVDQNLSFRDCLLGKSTHELNTQGKNRIEYWEQHVINWIARSDVLIIEYDDLLKCTISAVEAISRHIKCPARSSQRSITPTGIGRGLTDRFLKNGPEPVWESEIADLVKVTVERLATVQPQISRYVDRWIAASGAKESGAHRLTL